MDPRPDPLMALLQTLGSIVVWLIGFNPLGRAGRLKAGIREGSQGRDG